MSAKSKMFWVSNRLFMMLGRWWNWVRAYFAFNQYVKSHTLVQNIVGIPSIGYNKTLTWELGNVQVFLSDFKKIKDAVINGRLNNIDINLTEGKNSAVPDALIQRCYLRLFQLVSHDAHVSSLRFLLSGPINNTVVRALAECIRHNKSMTSLNLNRFGDHDDHTLTEKHAKLLELALQENKTLKTLIVRTLTTPEKITKISPDSDFSAVRQRIAARMAQRQPAPTIHGANPPPAFAYNKGTNQAALRRGAEQTQDPHPESFCAMM